MTPKQPGAIAPSAVRRTTNPLTEESRQVWARWLEDRAERDRAASIEATAQTPLETASTALEIAEATAAPQHSQLAGKRRR